MSKILEILAVVAFNCNIDGNLAFEWEKWKKRFQYYVAAAGMSDNKEKRAVLLNLIGPARQEIFNTLSLSLLSFSQTFPNNCADNGIIRSSDQKLT